MLLIDICGKRDLPLEASMEALRIALTLLVRGLLAAEGENAVVDKQLDILGGQARHLGGDEKLVIAVLDIDAGPVRRSASKVAEAAEGRRFEEVVEQSVHFAAEGTQRAEFLPP